MSVIGSWIKKTYKDTNVDYAVYTKSEYYSLPGGIVIRVSDHFKQSFDEMYNIQIILSKNNQTVYMVQCENCLHIYTFTCAEVKSFIRNYVMLNEMRKFHEQVGVAAHNIQTTSSKKKKEKFDAEMRKTCMNECECRIGEIGYSVFAAELCKKFKLYHTLAPSSRKLVKRLAAQPLSFLEIVDCLNSAVTSKGKFDVEAFRSIVEKYEKNTKT